LENASLGSEQECRIRLHSQPWQNNAITAIAAMDIFKSIKKDVKKHGQNLARLFEKAEALAAESGDKKFVLFLKKERAKVEQVFDSIATTSESFLPAFQAELKKRTKQLDAKIKSLNKSKDSLISDNYLLEYKKKELLMLTSKLEEAYDEISIKNQELMQQQDMIGEQRDRLNAVHAEILAKNEELEKQKGALLDQSDYLHEANEWVTSMHQQLEKQKDEILQKNEELLSLNNEKNNLIGIVAHDLKSPLSQIRGLLSIMKLTSENLSEETLSYIDMMEKSSGRLSDMIAKILDVEAIESQKLNLATEEVDLGAILHSLVDRYKLPAAQKQIHICESLGNGYRSMLDPGYAEQVFENLLSNAIKFSPTDRKIWINLVLTGESVIAEIKDEGPGLSESDKKKLFGKYQKLSAKPTGNETSTGLGLSIVKKFVEAMNGRIWCESEVGQGASFFVSFPRSQLSSNGISLS
jgi:signal transduction histidine kinase